MLMKKAIKLLPCIESFDYFQTTTKFLPRYFQPLRSISCEHMKAPFKDHEVFDGHRENPDARDGPVILPGNTADYLIIGGGIMGQALAYNLWKFIERTSPMKATKHMSCTIAIVEKEPSLANSATALSVGGIRSQFSHPSNVKLSMESANFLRKIKLHLSTVREPNPDVQYNPQGYLMMATAAGAEQLMKNYNTQIECGAKIMLFTQQHLKDTFPWMNVEGIELATYGLENEGWFDPSSLAAAFKHKNLSFCVNQLKGEVVGFKKEILKDRSDVSLPVTHSNEGRIINVDERIDGVYVKMPEHEKPVYIKCHMMFNCAGAESGQLAQLAGIGTDQSHPILKHKLPVERRKRYVYVFHCPDGPMFDCPMIIDPSGVYVRREGLGGKYICGSSPPEDEEPDTKDLEVNYDYFYEAIWPKLAYRIPVFEKLKVTSAWAGFYDYNAYDQNAVIGQHPYYSNMAFLTGFSGHGIQQAQAASRALAEQIVNGIKDGERAELEPFSFMRIIENRPLLENEII